MADPRLLAKDTSSGDDGCPSVWLENGQLTILGPEADLSTLKNVLPGETACHISIDVVRRALATYDQETGK